MKLITSLLLLEARYIPDPMSTQFVTPALPLESVIVPSVPLLKEKLRHDWQLEEEEIPRSQELPGCCIGGKG